MDTVEHIVFGCENRSRKRRRSQKEVKVLNLDNMKNTMLESMENWRLIRNMVHDIM